MKCTRCKNTNLVSKLLVDNNTQWYCLDCLNVSLVLSEENKKKLEDEKAAKKAAFAVIFSCQKCGSDRFKYHQSFDCFGGTGHFRLYHCEVCNHRYKQQENPKDS